MALHAQGSLWVGEQHARVIRTMRVVALEAAALLDGGVHDSLVRDRMAPCAEVIPRNDERESMHLRIALYVACITPRLRHVVHDRVGDDVLVALRRAGRHWAVEDSRSGAPLPSGQTGGDRDPQEGTGAEHGARLHGRRFHCSEVMQRVCLRRRGLRAVDPVVPDLSVSQRRDSSNPIFSSVRKSPRRGRACCADSVVAPRLHTDSH